MIAMLPEESKQLNDSFSLLV